MLISKQAFYVVHLKQASYKKIFRTVSVIPRLNLDDCFHYIAGQSAELLMFEHHKLIIRS